MIKIRGCELEMTEVAGQKVTSVKYEYDVYIRSDCVSFVYIHPMTDFTSFATPGGILSTREPMESLRDRIEADSLPNQMAKHLRQDE